ncbi:GNAT family N-acetyltransferase [Streptomyces sp. MUM 203J]|uniref:GNAT family N-acetyltransferase n=1 Tax=Streptomyces sp. MUM 203J TaxID=2791990 RepID=UPI001F040530|nr:GNAT family N-acetyltransferase [Streptomyces sp. MUM 203J]MCH0540905.1 GNAT family N-acetyltransferase [Streptomyces sp. MUM 203J]
MDSVTEGALRLTALIDPVESAHGRRLVWLAEGADGSPAGTASLRLLLGDGQRHLAEAEIRVHPAERRRGVATRLLGALVDAAREDGRRSLVAQADEGSAGAGFLAARGFRTALALVYARLPLAEADMAALHTEADTPRPGYRLVAWEGAVPETLAPSFVASRRAMDDMPTGAVDHGTVKWDLERVRAAAAAVAARGELLHTVAAVDSADGTVAGFTELVVPGDGTGDAQHYGTGVLPEHRGHGLGRWMKAASILHARERHPGLGGLLTDTATTNPYMQRINDDLGYRPVRTAHEYELDISSWSGSAPAR